MRLLLLISLFIMTPINGMDIGIPLANLSLYLQRKREEAEQRQKASLKNNKKKKQPALQLADTANANSDREPSQDHSDDKEEQ